MTTLATILTTTRTADELEGLDGLVLLDPGEWAFAEVKPIPPRSIDSGEDIVLVATTGDTFIGTVHDGGDLDGEQPNDRSILIELR